MESTTNDTRRNEKTRSEIEMGDDEELFEIDLEVVDNIPPPCYYWDCYAAPTTKALLANCLLPATDLSRAVPVLSKSTSDDQRIVSVSFRDLRTSRSRFSKMQTLEEFAELYLLRTSRPAHLVRVPSMD